MPFSTRAGPGSGADAAPPPGTEGVQTKESSGHPILHVAAEGLEAVGGQASVCVWEGSDGSSRGPAFQGRRGSGQSLSQGPPRLAFSARGGHARKPGLPAIPLSLVDPKLILPLGWNRGSPHLRGRAFEVRREG